VVAAAAVAAAAVGVVFHRGGGNGTVTPETPSNMAGRIPGGPCSCAPCALTPFCAI
jgi:hypothetical protein